MNISDKLKLARKQAKLNQKEVAAALSVDVMTISRYENNKLLPPLDKIKQLSLLYSVPVAYLVSESDTEIDSIKEWLNTLNKTDLTAISEYIEKLNRAK